jgi:hypothetical protein
MSTLRNGIEYKDGKQWFWSDGVIRFIKSLSGPRAGRWRQMFWTGPKLDARRLPV